MQEHLLNKSLFIRGYELENYLTQRNRVQFLVVMR